MPNTKPEDVKPTPKPDASASGEKATKADKEAGKHPAELIQKGVDEGKYTVEQLYIMRNDPQYHANVINDGSDTKSAPIVSVSEAALEKAIGGPKPEPGPVG